MKKITVILLLSAVILIFSACGSGSSKNKEKREEGTIYGRCYENGTCNEGLTCDTENNVCIRDNGQPENDSDNTDSTSDNDSDIAPATDNGDSADDSDDSTPEEDGPDTEVTVKATSFGNICTGQEEECFDNENDLKKCPAEGSDFYGQDSQYAAKGLCVPQKFSIDRTVKNEKIVIDENTGTQWQYTIPEEEFYLEDAEEYCENLVYGGYSDWRVPYLIETVSLFRDSQINWKYFPLPESESVAYMWSRNFVGNFLVSIFMGDTITQYDRENTALIRCARGDTLMKLSYPATAKAANNDLIVRDSATDLIWQYEYVSGKTWQEALEYCENLEYAGYSDWRLPNKNELFSLEYSGYLYYGSATTFPNTPSLTFWSSTTAPQYYYESSLKRDHAFSVDFATTELIHSSKSQKNSVRCVRHPSKPAINNEPSAEKSVTIGNICTGIKKCYKTPLYEDVATGALFQSSEIPCDYGEARGQDAQQAAKGVCLPQSFSIEDTSVENEKIVADNNTGLQWQQTISEGIFYSEADKYCAELNYGGHDDWRLPTIQELASIIDNSRVAPSMDTDYFPDSNVPDGDQGFFFWTSSPYTGTDNHYTWCISFNSGGIYEQQKNSRNFVRCVRGEKLAVNSFKPLVKKGDLVIKDTLSGLVWAADYTGTLYWTEALAYCNDLDYAGYTDWRLPNKNELLSLVNYDKIEPTSDFPELPIEQLWSSSPFDDSYYDSDYSFLEAFTIRFRMGYSSFDSVTSPLFFAICVR